MRKVLANLKQQHPIPETPGYLTLSPT